jgi:hypothetical protein
MSDTEPREQCPRHTTPPSIESTNHRCLSRQDRDASESLREQARIVDLQRCIDSMRKANSDLEARVVDLECSVGRIGSAFGQLSGLHDVVTGGASRGRGGNFSDRGSGGNGRRDFYNRSDPPRGGGEHGVHQPPFGNCPGGNFGGGRGWGRR